MEIYPDFIEMYSNDRTLFNKCVAKFKSIHTHLDTMTCEIILRTPLSVIDQINDDYATGKLKDVKLAPTHTDVICCEITHPDDPDYLEKLQYKSIQVK